MPGANQYQPVACSDRQNTQLIAAINIIAHGDAGVEGDGVVVRGDARGAAENTAVNISLHHSACVDNYDVARGAARVFCPAAVKIVDCGSGMEGDGIACDTATSGCGAAENAVLHRCTVVQRDGVPGRRARVVIPAEHEAGICCVGGVVHRHRAAVCPFSGGEGVGIACIAYVYIALQLHAGVSDGGCPSDLQVFVGANLAGVIVGHGVAAVAVHAGGEHGHAALQRGGNVHGLASSGADSGHGAAADDDGSPEERIVKPLAIGGHMDASADGQGAGSSTNTPFGVHRTAAGDGQVAAGVAAERCDIRACGQGVALRVDGQGAGGPLVADRWLAGDAGGVQGHIAFQHNFCAAGHGIGKVDGLDFLAAVRLFQR